MKVFAAVVVLLMSAIPAFAGLSEQAFRMEKNALATAIATENACGHKLNALSIRGYIYKTFEGKESELLSTINTDVGFVKLQLKSASNSQIRALCAAAALFISKNNLSP